VLGGLAFAAVGPKVSRFRPETAIALVVAANAVMVAAFALVPAMRLVDAPAPARER
jgi:hypothetical protein